MRLEEEEDDQDRRWMHEKDNQETSEEDKDAWTRTWRTG